MREDDSWEALLVAFRSHLQSRATRDTYTVVARIFLRWTDARPENLQEFHLQEYVSYLADRTSVAPRWPGGPISRGTASMYRRHLKSFLLWLEKRGKLPAISREEIIDALPPGAEDVQRPHNILSDAETLALLDAAASLRDRCILALGLFAGLRNEEITKVERAHLGRDHQGAYLLVHGKGDKDAVVSISDGLYDLLQAYLSSAGTTGRLWTIGTNRVWVIVRQAAQRAGIAKRVTVHALRHTYAYNLVRSGVPLHIIRLMLRHSNLAVTTRYLEHTERAEVARYAPALPRSDTER